MIWNFDLLQAHFGRDVLLLTSASRRLVSNWIPPLAGVAGHWSGLMGDEVAVAWCELPDVPEVLA